MAERKKYEPPQADKGDMAHTAGRALLSAIPWVGGAAVEVFRAVLMPPLQRRQQEWIDKVANGLRRFEEEHRIKLDDLHSNDVFIDTFVRVTHLALRISQREKREALRNAVLNAATENAPDQAKQQIYLEYIDRFTVWHLKVLKLFDNPQVWADDNNRDFSKVFLGSPELILSEAYHQLYVDHALCRQIWNDLRASRLLISDSMHTFEKVAKLMGRRTSCHGRGFLQFIEAPSMSDSG